MLDMHSYTTGTYIRAYKLILQQSSTSEGAHQVNWPIHSLESWGGKVWPCNLTWQDKVSAVLRPKHLKQALLHSFDFLPAREEAEDPT